MMHPPQNDVTLNCLRRYLVEDTSIVRYLVREDSRVTRGKTEVFSSVNQSDHLFRPGLCHIGWNSRRISGSKILAFASLSSAPVSYVEPNLNDYLALDLLNQILGLFICSRDSCSTQPDCQESGVIAGQSLDSLGLSIDIRICHCFSVHFPIVLFHDFSVLEIKVRI
jgi:hypothetical protein